MPAPVVLATNESTTSTAGTSHVVSLPAFAGGAAAHVGELLIVVMNLGSTAATINALTGWTELVDEGVAGGMFIAWRKVDGTEGSTVTFTSSAATRSAEITYLIAGAEDPSVTAPAISTVATGSSTTPNPGSVTAPSIRNSDWLYIAAFGRDGEAADDDAWVTASPTGYSNRLAKTGGTAGVNLGALVSTATRTGSFTAEDPATFTATTGAWRAFTVAIGAATVATPVASPEDKMLVLGVGGLRKIKPRPGQGVQAAPTGDNVPQGGAVAAGSGPVALVATPQGGALADGVAPTVRVALTIAGALADGVAPTTREAVPQGGALAAGTGPAALVPVGQGGALAGGNAPLEGFVETPVPGGALAAGVGPTARVDVSQGGGVAGGVAPAEPVAPFMAQRDLTRHFLLLGPGGFRKLLVGVETPGIGPTIDTPTPGGAIASGIGPRADFATDPDFTLPFRIRSVHTPAPMFFGPAGLRKFRRRFEVPSVPAAPTTNTPTPGGAVADGVQPTVRVAMVQGGGLAAGLAPAPSVTVTQGGGVAAGLAPVPVRVAVPQGGAIAGGVPPSDGIASSETPPPGGAVAQGVGPVAKAAVVASGGVADGRGPSARAAIVLSGAVAQGNPPGPGTPLVLSGAVAQGTTNNVARVAVGQGGGTAGGQLVDPLQVFIILQFGPASPSGGQRAGSPSSSGAFGPASPGKVRV